MECSNVTSRFPECSRCLIGEAPFAEEEEREREASPPLVPVPSSPPSRPSPNLTFRDPLFLLLLLPPPSFTPSGFHILLSSHSSAASQSESICATRPPARAPCGHVPARHVLSPYPRGESGFLSPGAFDVHTLALASLRRFDHTCLLHHVA